LDDRPRHFPLATAARFDQSLTLRMKTGSPILDQRRAAVY
jgi:hypothetical protein